MLEERLFVGTEIDIQNLCPTASNGIAHFER